MKFDTTRVAVVDQSRNTLLVRGMAPATSGTFDYDAIGQALIKRGTDIAGKKLIVVCVIDNIGERSVWEPEMQAFGVDPNSIPTSQWPPYLNRPNYQPGKPIGSGQWTSGKFSGVGDMYWWPFEGIPAGEAHPEVYLTNPGWDFSGAVDLIGDLFHTEENAVVYFHCMLGADRTGALHTAYLMHDKGMTLEEASRGADSATSAKGPNADYQRLREAYAAWCP